MISTKKLRTRQRLKQENHQEVGTIRELSSQDKTRLVKVIVYQDPPIELELHIRSWFQKWICHQGPDRSFFIGNKQLPLCARCLGLYLSFLLAVPLSLSEMKHIRTLGLFEVVFLEALFVIPLLIDGFTQLLNLRQSNNSLRLVTGLLAGFGSANFLCYLVYRLTQL